MKNILRSLGFLVSLMLVSCSSNDDGGGGGGGGGGVLETATYRVTFMPNFTDQTHPSDYPQNAGFSKMFLMAHSGSTGVFRTGVNASDGLENYVENGDISTLDLEHTPINENDPITIRRIGNDIGPTATDAIEITITPNTPLLSFVSKISPSPDWFVGIDSFSLVNPDSSLVEEIELLLTGFDAGTDGGTTYDSPDFPQNGAVSIVSGDPFVNPTTGAIARFGTLKIERIDNGIQ